MSSSGLQPIEPKVADSEWAELQQSDLYNEDLAPVSPERRKWKLWSFAALWISMSACIPTYMLASSLIGGGMNWWQAVLTIFLGNLIVLIPMVLNAHAGTRYGIPFPVYCRASFGTRGANIPALLRALVACGWFGIQAWIGGNAIYKILAVFWPSLAAGAPISFLGITLPQFICFLFFWAINMCGGLQGHRFHPLAAEHQSAAADCTRPAAALVGVSRGGRLRPDSLATLRVRSGPAESRTVLALLFPGAHRHDRFWATLSLNIPDFSRYAVTQRDQIIGQALGLPLTMALYSFIGVAVTSATTIIYGQTIWDPVDVLTRFTNPVLLVVAMIALCIATLATNIAANVVSPANDFAHLAPRKISFRIGGFITGIIGIVMMPWKLVADPSGYIFTWLIGYSALLGPIGGIMIADYFVCRKRTLNLAALYDAKGEYSYTRGFNLAAIVALVLSVLPNLPGFLVTTKVLSGENVPAILVESYHYAWFIGFALAFVIYLVAFQIQRRPRRTTI